MGALVKGEAADVVNLLFCVVGIYAAYLTQARRTQLPEPRS